MAAIDVVAIGSKEFDVTVREGTDESSHRVTVPDGYVDDIGLGDDAPLNRLVHESFRFLLEREPKEQIMRTFDLPTIERYFPEYRETIADRVRSATP